MSDNKYKSISDILLGLHDDDLFITPPSNFSTDLYKTKKKSTPPATAPVARTNKIRPRIPAVIKPKQETIISMGARRKQLSNVIRTTPNVKQEVLKEYYEVSEKIDKTISNKWPEDKKDTNK